MFIFELEGVAHGQLDLRDYHDRRRNGRHDPHSLDLKPPHELAKEMLSSEGGRRKDEIGS